MQERRMFHVTLTRTLCGHIESRIGVDVESFDEIAAGLKAEEQNHGWLCENVAILASKRMEE